ncbi:MAG: hypothetical protein R2819_12255 [Allomuricauda sp.]
MKKHTTQITVLLAVLLFSVSTLKSQHRFILAEEYEISHTLASLWGTKVTVINMIPNLQSNETNQDSEPNIAVNPANTSRIVGSAFTPNPSGSTATAPIYISTDGGNTWALNNIVPSGNGSTNDISLKFGTQGNTLYTGILFGGANPTTMNILRSSNPFGSTNMTVLVSRANVDQPYVNAITSPGLVLRPPLVNQLIEMKLIPTVSRSSLIPLFFLDRDRVFVGNNDFNSSPQTATVDHSASARTAPPPAGFTSTVVESRTTNGQDRPSVRCSANIDGTVYALFARTTASSGTNRTCDVTVVRDDSFATGTAPFTALTGGDGNSGVLVATGVNMPFINAAGGLGQNRLGSHMSISVDPNNSNEVYIAWTDRAGTTGTNLHVRRSGDRGVNWSADLLTVTNGLNPALAVNSLGVVGVVYQQLTGTGSNQKWETHFQRSSNDGGLWTDMTLSQFLDNNPAPTFQPYLGDYCDLMSVGKNFYGVFSASNLPDTNNFPQGVIYQRNANFTTKVLRNTANTGNVNVSIDPFFFKIEFGLRRSICELCPSCCTVATMEPGRVILECASGEFCQIRDPVPKNCLVKFDCPGCDSTQLCPPYYHIYLDDFDPELWRVDLRTNSDQPVNYEVNRTKTGVVISFRPGKEEFVQKSIGEYDLVFNATGNVKAHTRYVVKTRLEVSDYRYQQHLQYGLSSVKN